MQIYRNAVYIITKLLICGTYLGFFFCATTICQNNLFTRLISLLGLEPNNLKAQLECEINGPDGNPVEADVSKLGPDGPFQVRYVQNNMITS